MSDLKIICEGEEVDLSDDVAHRNTLAYESDIDRTMWLHFLEMIEVDVVDCEIDDILEAIETIATR